MNMNLVHNILNIVIALVSAATAFLIATGCTALANGGLECSQSWINPAYTTMIVAALGITKTIMNVVRDGFSGLNKPQPPVKK